VDFDSTNGDSGGTMVSGATPIAYGIHVHSDEDTEPNARGWYTTVEYAQVTLSLERGVNIDWCITNAC
jgi:Trypsin